MAFVQIVEFTTSRFDEGQALIDEYAAATEGRRAKANVRVCADRDRPGVYLSIVEFESYEEAMRNSELPETQALAEQLAKLSDGPPSFRNLDVVQSMED